MKKIIIVFLLSHLSAFAQPIYCPPQIHCAQESKIDSCRFEAQQKPYWNKITGKKNMSGVYKNTYVSAPFYSYDQGYALCIYTHEQVYSTLTLHAKPESNLEMLIQDHEPWHAEETWWECAPKYESACPLQEQAALMIQNRTEDKIYLSNNISIHPNQFARLYEHDLSQGWVDIFDASNFIGRITVDLNHRLKITGLVLGDTDLAELFQVDGFNAVSIVMP